MLTTTIAVVWAVVWSLLIVPWYLWVRSLAINDLQLRAFQLFSVLYVAFAFAVFLEV